MNFTGLVKSGLRFIARMPAPISVGCTLTHRCNMHCAYCDFPAHATEELSTGEWKTAITQFARAGTIRFGFSGGEPLLRNDVAEIIAHARATGAKTTLCSNGILVPDRIGELRALDIYTTSLDGASAEIHDAQRKLPGSFEKALRGIEAALSAGKQVKTLTVLTPQTLGEVEGILYIADRMGFKAGFQPATPARLASDKVPSLTPPTEEVHEVARFLMDAKKKGRNVISSRAALARMLQYPHHDGGSQCQAAGKYFCYVGPRGEVFPCHITYDPREGAHPSGKDLGYVQAFESCRDGCDACPGCYIVPLTEMNLLFGLRPTTLWEQVREMFLH